MDGRTVSAVIGQSAGGVGRNLADALGKLDHRPLFVSALGDDLYGDFIIRSIAHTDMSGVEVRRGKRTACCNVLFDKSGECKLVIGDVTINSTISVQQASAHECSIIRSPVVVMDANIPEETMNYILDKCGQHGVPVWFEPTDLSVAWKPFKSELWKNLTFVSPNMNELKVIAKEMGVTLDTELDLKDTEKLIKQLIYLATPLVQNSITVMVTMGSIGILMVSKVTPDEVLINTLKKNGRNQKIHARFYPAVKTTNLINVSGAGDCLAAGFMTGILRGHTEPESVMLGVRAAQDSLQSVSAVPQAFKVNKTTNKKAYFINVQ